MSKGILDSIGIGMIVVASVILVAGCIKGIENMTFAQAGVMAVLSLGGIFLVLVAHRETL